MLVTRTRLHDLIDGIADAHVFVVSGAGTGKSVLARQLVERQPGWSLIDASDGDDNLQLEQGIDGGSPVLVVDSIEHLSDGACDRLIELSATRRLILLGRLLPERVVRGIVGATSIDTSQLLFDGEELERITGDATVAASLKLVTAGWPAAVGRMVGSVVDNTAESTASLDAGAIARRSTVVEPLLATCVKQLDTKSKLDLGRLAVPAALDRSLVTHVVPPDRWRRIQLAGVPVIGLDRDQIEFPRPVRQALRRMVPVSNEDLEPLITAMMDHGDVIAGLDVCAQVGWPQKAAEILAGLTPDQIYSIDGRKVRSLLSVLGSDLQAEPAAMLNMARITMAVGETDEARGIFEGAVALLEEGTLDTQPDQAMFQELLAELAFLEYQTGNFQRAAKLRDRCAELIPDGANTAARARFLETKAGLLTQEKQRGALLEAKTLFADAINIWSRLGHLTRAGGSLRFLVWYVLMELGQHGEAVELLDRAVRSGGVTAVETAMNHVGRSRCLGMLGRHEEAEAALADAEALVATLDVGWLQALAHWTRALNFSYVGDGDRTQEEVDNAAAALGPQAEGPNGARFRSEAAMALARCGRPAAAQTQLQLAQAVTGADPEDVALATATFEARFGDIQEALRLLDQLGDDIAVSPGVEWMVEAFTALARFRAGESEGADESLNRACELAAETGNPDVVQTVEGSLLAQLGGAPSVTGPEREPDRGPLIDIHLFGPFTVTIGGDRVEVARGHCSTLVKLLVLGSGVIHTEVAIDVLWPTASVMIGRRRLRNVLQRLRSVHPEIVERDGDILRLGPSVDADYWRVQRGLDAVMRSDPDGVDGQAGSALDILDAEFLPGDRYADWAEIHRVDLVARSLRAIDRMAEAALDAGDIDRAARLLERSTRIAPDDTRRAQRAASLVAEP